MENRTVALAILEDLIHWPLPSSNDSYDSDDVRRLGLIDDDVCNTGESASAGTTDDKHAEPCARREARYHAVLLLPLLCRRLGPRWVSTEVVPYLIRCVEEDDVRLSFLVGVVLMGLLLPRARSATETTAHSNEVKLSLGMSTAEQTFAKDPNHVTTSYLTLDSVRPVVEMLSASREESIRHFMAQVVIPHLCFGVGLEREVTLEGWDRRYIPPRCWLGEDNEAEGSDNMKDSRNTGWGFGWCGRGGTVLEARRDVVGNSGEEGYDSDSLLLQEMLNFTHDDECISLPRSVWGCHGTWLCRSNGSSTTARHRQRASTAPACTSLLWNAPLALYGASYASALCIDSGFDYFSLNIRARLLVNEIASWLSAFMSSEPQQGPSLEAVSFPDAPYASHNGGISNLKASKVSAMRPLRYCRNQVLATEYLEHGSAQREALRQRWERSLSLLQSLLESPHPGAVAVAVEMISGLLHTIQNALVGGLNNKILSSGSLVCVSLPKQPLRTAAELQEFTANMTRRNVLMVLAAATSTQRLPNTASETISLVQDALVEVRRALLSILRMHHLLLVEQAATITPSNASGPWGEGLLQVGLGPRELRMASLAVWDASHGPDVPGGTPRFFIESFPALEGSRDDLRHIPLLRYTERGILPFSSRLHRTVRLSVLRSLPFLLDLSDVFNANAPASRGAASAVTSDGGGGFCSLSTVSIKVVASVLVQLLAPAADVSELRSLFSVVTDPKGGAGCAAWLGMQCGMGPPDAGPAPAAGPGGLHSSAGGASALLDFGMVEATLEAARGCFVEVATAFPGLLRREYSKTVSISSRSPSRPLVDSELSSRLKGLLEHLFIVYYACVKYIAFHPFWKARWLLAKKLPGLTSALAYALLSLQRAVDTIKNTTTATTSPLAADVSLFYYQLCSLLTELWSAGEDAAHPPGAWVDDEEIEVRTAVLACAADTFAVMTQASIGLPRCSAEGASAKPTEQRGAGAGQFREVSHPFKVLALLLEAILQVCRCGLRDDQPQVRAAAPAALMSLFRAVSMLEDATMGTRRSRDVAWCKPQTWIVPHVGSEVVPQMVTDEGASWRAHWVGYLTQATNALLCLIEDPSPLVRLELASELADLIVDSTRRACKVGEDVAGGSVDAPTWCRVLLSCLESLSRHEVWRFRERYAALLCEICFKFLAPLYTFQHFSYAYDQTITSSRKAQGQQGSFYSDAWVCKQGSLSLLARTELLPMLVDVLFDKAKVVRDAALGHAVRLRAKLVFVQLFQRRENIPEQATRIRERPMPASGDRFVTDLLWPLIVGHPVAWKTNLNRSTLLRLAVRLHVDKVTVLLPLMSELAQDSVLNVRLAVAKTISDILLHSFSRQFINDEASGVCRPRSLIVTHDGIQGCDVVPASIFPSGSTRGSGLDPNTIAASAFVGVMALPPLTFTGDEKSGVVLQLLQQLLEDTSGDVRDEAAKAFEMCF